MKSTLEMLYSKKYKAWILSLVTEKTSSLNIQMIAIFKGFLQSFCQVRSVIDYTSPNPTYSSRAPSTAFSQILCCRCNGLEM